MLNEILRNERKKKGLNQVELVKIFNVSKQSVSNWESGKRTPDAQTIEQLADFFEVSTDYLLGRTFEEKKESTGKFSEKTLEAAELFEDLKDSQKETILKLIEELLETKEK
ncbi:helix-turn-helix transcriptional regulator [Listeria monocytogenes]